MQERSFVTNLILSCAAGSVAGIATVLATSPLARIEPYWVPEALVSFVAAVVWMMVGLRFGKSNPGLIGLVLFILGASAAWFLTKGIVHSVSPYYGLFSFAAACAGAEVGWSFHLRKQAIPLRASAALIPLVFILFAVAMSLYSASLGPSRRTIGADSVMRMYPAVSVAKPPNVQRYIWSKRGAGPVLTSDSTALIEFDPGSGQGRFRLKLVTDQRQVDSVCSVFRSRASDLVNSEVAAGTTPSFMTALPIRYPRCENGHVWAVE